MFTNVYGFYFVIIWPSRVASTSRLSLGKAVARVFVEALLASLLKKSLFLHPVPW